MKWIQRFFRFIKEGEQLLGEATEVLDSGLALADEVQKAGGELSHKAQRSESVV